MAGKGVLSGGRMSGPVVRIATLAIVLGLAVMIVSVAIVTGFQQEIRDKVIGFGAHIQINNYDFNTSYEPAPVSMKQPFYPGLKEEEGIRHIQVYATKAGIIRTDEEILGVVIKGVGSDYDWSFLDGKMVDGRTFRVSDTTASDEILVSKHIASVLKLKAGEKLSVFFIQDPPRARRFTIAGIYETGLEEFDRIYAFADIAHIRKINGWAGDRVAGFEVLIERYDDLDRLGARVNEIAGYRLMAQTIREIYPQLFDWLNLQDVNVAVILVLMGIVVVINMSTALLILILERTNMIGTLKALGATDMFIQRVFLFHAGRIIGRGMLWGNVAGIGLCLLQQQFGIVPLDQSSYYLSQVPVNLSAVHLAWLNLGTFAATMIVLILPSYIITSITPVRALRFG